jgi:hypothetical protein
MEKVINSYSQPHARVFFCEIIGIELPNGGRCHPEPRRRRGTPQLLTRFRDTSRGIYGCGVNAFEMR